MMSMKKKKFIKYNSIVYEKNGLKRKGRFLGWESTNNNVGWIQLEDKSIVLGNKKSIVYD
jgi:hypothetical protein